jgi:hypothetical protein
MTFKDTRATPAGAASFLSRANDCALETSSEPPQVLHLNPVEQSRGITDLPEARSAKTPGARSTTFEAALLMKPPTLPGVSDARSDVGSWSSLISVHQSEPND